MRFLAVCLSVFFSLPVLAENYPPIGTKMTVLQVSEHAYYVQGEAGTATENEGFISNAGFVVTSDGVVLFDALGTPSLAWTLLQKIREITDKPITHMVVSHYHADHIYGLQVFKEAGAKIIAPVGAHTYLGSETAANLLDDRMMSLEPWVNEQTYLVPPDQIIEKATRFSLGDLTFEMNYLGSAHSDGDLTLFIPEEGVLFSGDIIFEGRVPFVGDADTKVWLSKLKELETDGLKVLVPGHGPHAQDPNQAVRMTREYVAHLRSVMGKAVEDMVDFESAFEEEDWSTYKSMPAYDAAHRRNAYQVYLAMENESIVN
jgi:glyoxylase-like metal-dependent hydrolase (beta-lactamase superfamily II)